VLSPPPGLSCGSSGRIMRVAWPDIATAQASSTGQECALQISKSSSNSERAPSRDRVHAKTELVYEIRNECKGYQIARRECRTVALAQGESGDRVPPPPECFPAHGEQFANLALRVSHRPQTIWSMLPLQLVFFDEFEPAMF
jgi:hypothetical protein